MGAIDTYVAFLDEILETTGFVRHAGVLKSRIGPIVHWDAAGDLRPTLRAYLDSKPVEDRVYQSFLVAAHAGFEQFVSALLEDACELVSKKRMASAEVEKRMPGLLSKFRRASGSALAASLSPRDHWKIDYDGLVESLATTHAASSMSNVLGRIFVVEARSIDKEGLQKQLDTIGYRLSWDEVGKKPLFQKILSTSGTRDTSKAASELLDQLCSRRNALAHSQGALSVGGDELETFLAYYRALAEHVAASALAFVSKQLK